MRIALFAGVGIASAAVGLGAYGIHLFRALELHTVDARFAIRGSQGTPKDVVVVQIDDTTFNDLNNRHLAAQWPFHRRYHAQVIDHIAAGRPKAIAYDIQFTERTDAADDTALIQSVAKAGHVVLATTEVDAQGHANVFGGDSVVRSIGATVGNAVLPSDPDGVIRRVPYSTQGLTSFGVAAAEVALGRRIASPGAGSAWIDFAGPPGTVKTYSFSKVMLGLVPASAFTGKIVMVGPSAPSLQDVHATSASSSQVMSGAEIQANAVETALHGFPLRSLATGWNLSLIVLLALIAPLAGLRFGGWRPSVIALAAGAVFAGAVQLAFDHGRVVLFTYPLAAMGLSIVGSLAGHYLLEAFERARTRDVFARFVPASVVDQVLARTDGELRLGGEEVFGTVMFTDLRGFTTFSEALDAPQVIGLLNRYLSEMSEAVLAHGGTLVSYTGDGMMAVFGAPLEQADHADRALAAAREMLEERLPRFNERLREEGYEQGFKMGIGLNSGPFMSGNVGSEQRLEYTAIGDTINTASRIEGMTKGTPYALFLADSTREALTSETDDLLYVDEMAVRGRKAAIRLWSLRGDAVLKLDWQAEVAKTAPAPEVEPAVV
jgi:adenylate cyclase